MAEADSAVPDFKQGVSVRDLQDGGMIKGRVGEDEVVLARNGDHLFAVGAHCTHYHGPLIDGVVTGDTIRCPWHHACFSLRNGDALRPPALDPVSCWKVERKGDTAFVRDKLPEPSPQAAARGPESVVIVGGGAAGLAAADMLRREGYAGPVTILSADADGPVDRPNLSKDYLAGTAKEDWIPLRGPEFFTERRIDLKTGARVASIDVSGRQVKLENGGAVTFGSLLLATGADPIHLPIPGAEGPNVHYLRTFADSRAIAAKAGGAKRAVVAGASFIGLEVAASLRARDIEVQVVAPGKLPLERIMGPEIGAWVKQLHESHGVTFHLGETVTKVDGRTVTLSGGSTLEADFVVMGVGVRPSIALAEKAGLTMDRGIVVNEYLETSTPGVFAAGDVARYPDPHSGERVRIEHWVVAERQGQTAARNMLGRREKFDAVPFFWSQHYDISINYVGHAETWDALTVDGKPEETDCTVTYSKGGRTLAVATIFRDKESLNAEVAMERATARA
jgi:apoptosis-inducing factor 3